jgi:phosphoglycerate kinase
MPRTLDGLAAEGSTLGVRVDINSPLSSDDELADDARLRAHLETLSELVARDAGVVVLAHQGRPGGEEFARLRPHAERLDDLLSAPVAYVDSTMDAAARDRIDSLASGEVLVLENTRFYAEEYMTFDPLEAADTHLVADLAPALDGYVVDAFAAAHRSQPSLVGFTPRLPTVAGRLLERELDVLRGVASAPRPRAFVLGGAKVEDSIDVAWSVLESGRADDLLVTGLVGNAFLAADGVDLGDGAGVVEERGWDQVERAGDLLDAYGDSVHLPVDVAVARDGQRRELGVNRMPPRRGELPKDVGEQTVARYRSLLSRAATVVLNGPAGVVEDDLFRAGTRGVFEAATRVDHSVVGGGDTAAVVRRLDVEGFDHVSTGGGAALRALTGESLPVVDAIREHGLDPATPGTETDEGRGT